MSSFVHNQPLFLWTCVKTISWMKRVFYGYILTHYCIGIAAFHSFYLRLLHLTVLMSDSACWGTMSTTAEMWELMFFPCNTAVVSSKTISIELKGNSLLSYIPHLQPECFLTPQQSTSDVLSWNSVGLVSARILSKVC